MILHIKVRPASRTGWKNVALLRYIFQKYLSSRWEVADALKSLFG